MIIGRNTLWRAAIAAGVLSAVLPCSFLGQPVQAVEAANPAAGTGSPQDGNKPASAKDELQAFTLETITVEAKRPDWEAKLSPGTVTVIRPGDYKGEQKSLPDLLKMVPGVHVREINGKGQYTTVSVRGSTASQVGVFVDGVLFNLGGDAAADISTIPVKNVERIEVYRGYIPARFGGTYMGGVINVVTKRPTKANIQANIGKSSYHGYRGGLQIDQPLGKGTLMIGVNREQSKGDFRYKNLASEKIQGPQYRQYVADWTQNIENFPKEQLELSNRIGIVSGEEKEYYQNHLDEWKQMLEGDAYGAKVKTFYAGDLLRQINSMEVFTPEEYDLVVEDPYDPETGEMLPEIERKFEPFWRVNTAVYSNPEAAALLHKWADTIDNNEGYEAYLAAVADLKNNKDSFIEDYVEYHAGHRISEANPATSNEYKNYVEQKEKYEKYVRLLGNHWRYRRNNDYKNTDVIAKWQDDHWIVKATWKEINRHLPTGMFGWGGSYGFVDTDGLFYGNAQRKQKLTSKEALVGRRDTSGNLEWGWNVNYLDQDKRYRCENWEILDSLNDNIPEFYSQIPFRKWSAFDSTRWGGGIDGTYKAGHNHLLEFMVNYSDEHLKVAGSRVTDELLDPGYSAAARYRTRYKQRLFNAQIQDTITLNKKGDVWLTPSLRYNRAQTWGSKGAGYDKVVGHPMQWMFEAIDQTDQKVTWQLALKKQFSDHFTLRGTAGTYYRLLNLYEIAGDGGGILPAPLGGNKPGEKVRGLRFPLPEEGHNYDISAIWDGKFLGAANKTQLTWFWRKSDNVLRLWRGGFDYWTYFNDAKGLDRGLELQTDFNWNKFDFTLGATYLKSTRQTRDTSPTGGHYWYSVSSAYTPQWEGFARLAYRPTEKTTLFGEVKFIDKMCIRLEKLDPTMEASLTTFNTGVKHKCGKNFEMALGCNDVFNRGPKQRIILTGAWAATPGALAGNTDFPLQGRTYYASARYRF